MLHCFVHGVWEKCRSSNIEIIEHVWFFVFFRSNHLYFSELRRLLYILLLFSSFQVMSLMTVVVVDERRGMKL